MKTLETLIKSTAERGKNKGKPIPRATPRQLPLWNESLRGLPNDIARSALFTCANRRAPRIRYERAKIASLSNCDLIYTGTELRQDDEDVFLQIVHFARTQPLENGFEITGYQLIKALGWSGNKASYTRLREIIERLKEGTVKITAHSGRGVFANSLIRKYAWKDENDESKALEKWRIWVEQEAVTLFADDQYTLLDWQDRTKLGQLAKWLHSFYYTHREPIPYTAERLQALCGSKNANLRSFRRDLKNALDELVNISFITAWKHGAATDTFIVVRNHYPRGIAHNSQAAIGHGAKRE